MTIAELVAKLDKLDALCERTNIWGNAAEAIRRLIAENARLSASMEQFKNVDFHSKPINDQPLPALLATKQAESACEFLPRAIAYGALSQKGSTE